MTVTAVIAEDEPLLRADLREALAGLWPELDVVAEVGDGAEAILAMERHRPSILFLIQMPGQSGLEVAARASGRAHVVFVTAYSAHAAGRRGWESIRAPLTVPRGRELLVVTTEEICYLRAANKYTSVFTPLRHRREVLPVSSAYAHLFKHY
jgi:DNA-binding LytR/AlgR family response regulator